MTELNQKSRVRIIIGLMVLVIGFLSPLLSFYVSEWDLNEGLKVTIIGALVFGIPEVLMIIAIALMGKEAWDFIKDKLSENVAFLVPKKVSKTRYFIGVTLFTLCLIEGAVEIHSNIIQDFMADYLSTYHWAMNGLFLLSFFVAGGEFWDKIKSLYVYEGKQV